MKKPSKKLSLHKETLKHLTAPSLRRAAGGGFLLVLSKDKDTDCLCPKVIPGGAALNEGAIVSMFEGACTQLPTLPGM